MKVSKKKEKAAKVDQDKGNMAKRKIKKGKKMKRASASAEA
jgi:hypothetical protein